MPKVSLNNIEIEYEAMVNPSDKPLLMVVRHSLPPESWEQIINAMIANIDRIK